MPEPVDAESAALTTHWPSSAKSALVDAPSNGKAERFVPFTSRS
jgi:hypothetical protein